VKVTQVDRNSRERRHLERRAEIGLIDERVRPVLRSAIADEPPAANVPDPRLRNAVACVERHLRLSIEAQRGSGDLDDRYFEPRFCAGGSGA
jgi:hypothetical protein